MQPSDLSQTPKKPRMFNVLSDPRGFPGSSWIPLLEVAKREMRKPSGFQRKKNQTGQRPSDFCWEKTARLTSTRAREDLLLSGNLS